MRWLVALALVFGVVACRPLRGDRAEDLKVPQQKTRPAEAPAVAAIQFVDECSTDFSGNPNQVIQQTQIAEQRTALGETALEQADKATTGSTKVNLLVDAIAYFRHALMKDPYNVPATLKLAVAYDRALRRGCALAMLGRLAKLSYHPKWAAEAHRHIDTVETNQHWFKGYRRDAMTVLGRSWTPRP